MPDVRVGLTRLFDVFLLVLDRTGAAARLQALPFLPAAMPLAHRVAWAAVAGATVVLLLYAALASGEDKGVRAFRATTLLLGVTLPLVALRLVPGRSGNAFGGAVLAMVLLAGFLHRFLARRRRKGKAARLIEKVRWWLEAAGFFLFAFSATRLVAGKGVSVPLAFWSLFLLRLSIADLLDPSRLARETGLTKSARKDLKAAGRPKLTMTRRGRRALAGLAKILLLVLWLSLPFVAALARGEVARGEWPPRMLLLTLYPAVALALTAVLLLVEAGRGLTRAPFESARGALVGLATLLYLVLAYADPAFAVYRHALPGLYLLETAFAFLLGAASRGR